ncbi:beta-ketoacyl synthase chain length factor [Paraburkholderia antibiotica]|uniref:Beta-ketoacyl synthase chain length factor n=1 Tax=Paraburkholderia antibiotica TaxID=2728839 RepID=A0A7X9X0Y0_9BURK|nr:beta-ketoacyl synthase chain length factor [Paraburkholderia antibiotica]NML29405.1 beta-ketoacyl synthase chain length factor [Paraburkholderia antibiotica]
MPDLHWTIPVGRWSSWPATASAAPDIGFIEPIVRRRLSTLSKVALKVAHDCVAQEPVCVVFASRHGELRRTTDILRSISAGEPVSPTAFSLSVLNAMTGVFGIARGDRSAASAVSAGAETLGYALLEAYAQYQTQAQTQTATPVLLVYADEPADLAYGTIEDEVQGGAIALLLDKDAAAGHIVCSLTRGQPRDDAQGDTRTAADSAASFPTQSQALLHCLETGQPACWQRAGVRWHWRWHDRAA